MDERFVAELIEDMEHMGRLLERCVRRLRSQVSAGAMPATIGPVAEVPRISGTRDDIRAEIDRQRKAIMAQVDEIKAQAMQAATAAKGGASGAAMGASGLGSLATPGGIGGISSEVMEELRRKLAEKTDKAEKPEEDKT